MPTFLQHGNICLQAYLFDVQSALTEPFIVGGIGEQ